MEDSVQSLVKKQMRNCKCFVQVCNENRRKVLALLQRGFEYYRGVMFVNPPHDDAFLRSLSSGGNWQFYSDQLQALERDLREVNRKCLGVRNRVVETRGEVKAFRFQLEGVSRKENANRSPLALLACQRKTDIFERRSIMENKLGIATLSVCSLEKEQELLNQEKIAAKRLQTALLKNAFSGCLRHVCETSSKESDQEEPIWGHLPQQAF
jgi:hypothetical protein